MAEKQSFEKVKDTKLVKRREIEVVVNGLPQLRKWFPGDFLDLHDFIWTWIMQQSYSTLL